MRLQTTLSWTTDPFFFGHYMSLPCLWLTWLKQSHLSCTHVAGLKSRFLYGYNASWHGNTGCFISMIWRTGCVHTGIMMILIPCSNDTWILLITQPILTGAGSKSTPGWTQKMISDKLVLKEWCSKVIPDMALLPEFHFWYAKRWF